MRCRLPFFLLVTIVLIGLLSSQIKINGAEVGGAIYIRLDGKVEGTDGILRNREIYTFTCNIFDEIALEKDNIVIDGAGYTLQGSGLFASIGINLTRRANVTIRNLKIRGFYHGIRLTKSLNNTFAANDIADNRKSGIYLRYSHYNTMLQNNITSNDYGIRLYNSTGNTISQNDIANSAFDGVDLWFSSNNTVRCNLIRYNGYGLYLHSSSNNSVHGNTIETNSKIGIYFWRSSDNCITYNSVVNNTQQARIRSSTNFWDDGKEGNYWGDYEEKYPTAMEIDGSGIWDTPYVIDETNQDNYPIVSESLSLIVLPLLIIVTLMAIVASRRKSKVYNPSSPD